VLEFLPIEVFFQLICCGIYRIKLINFNTDEKNRAQNCITKSNIFASVVSDVYSKRDTAITKHMLNNLLNLSLCPANKAWFSQEPDSDSSMANRKLKMEL